MQLKEVRHGIKIYSAKSINNFGEFFPLNKYIIYDSKLDKYPKLKNLIINHELNHRFDSPFKAIKRDMIIYWKIPQQDEFIDFYDDWKQDKSYNKIRRYMKIYNILHNLSLVIFSFTSLTSIIFKRKRKKC